MILVIAWINKLFINHPFDNNSYALYSRAGQLDE